MSQISIKKNYIYSMFFQVLSLIAPFVTAPYIARILGVAGVGIYSYTQSIMTYFTLFAALGTASYGAREIARCRNDIYQCSKTFWEIELVSVLSTVFCTIAWMVLVYFSSSNRVYFIALIPQLFATMFDISWFYYGQERIGYIVFWNSFFKIVGIISIFVLIKSSDDLVKYILINSFILLLSNISMWFFLPTMLVKVNPYQFVIKQHCRETLIYFIPTIATTIYTLLDKILIGFITHSGYQNGYYEQATKIVNMSKVMVFVSVNSVLTARISFLFTEKRIDEIKEKIGKSINLILLLAFGVTFGLVSVAKDFVPLFFGEGYEPVVMLLYLMAPLVLIVGVSNCLGSQYYNPAGLRAKSSRYIIVGALVNLVLNMILIPSLQAVGAVVGSLIAELVISVLYLVNCSGFLSVKQIVIYSYKRIIAGTVMFVVVRVVSNCMLNNICLLGVEIVVGITIYVVCLFVLKDDMLFYFLSVLMERIRKDG